MTHADEWFFSIAFGIVTAILWAIRGRLKRIEEKLDKMSDK
jgi:hypothetical protein